MTPLERLKTTGCWKLEETLLFYPGCYFIKNGETVKFRGLIAQCRNKRKKKMISLGVNKSHYINLSLENCNIIIDTRFVGVQGIGSWNKEYNLVSCEKFDLF